ncbi:MAG: hypothetical protein HYT15_04255 [Candidatus Magasanikbacteria bacterium]|nr:hypothetical protein [Candidatus Magasanikbacteria bacterium]
MEKKLASPGLSTRGLAICMLLVLGLIFGYRYCFNSNSPLATSVVNQPTVPKQDNAPTGFLISEEGLQTVRNNNCSCTESGIICEAMIIYKARICSQGGSCSWRGTPVARGYVNLDDPDKLIMQQEPQATPLPMCMCSPQVNKPNGRDLRPHYKPAGHNRSSPNDTSPTGLSI